MFQNCSYYDYFDKSINLNEAKNIVNDVNCGSEANGALMRVSAIPYWIVKNNLDISIGVNYAKEDAKLSHPNIVCQECNAIYVFTISHLLKGVSLESIIKLTDDFVTKHISSEKVKQWYFEESLDITNLDATRQIGHVRWGFVLAMYFLRHPEYTFEEAIKITLMKGGDTDTNAAIVGGLVGSYRYIPDYMKNPVLDFDCTLEGRKHHKRPAEYSVKKLLLI
jgi:ADP-ribosylglycohydrolase